MRPPPRCPDEPGPGMEKLIIWAANTKAPSTPIRAGLPDSGASRSRRTEYAMSPAVAAQPAAPTAGEIRASDMCMRHLCYAAAFHAIEAAVGDGLAGTEHASKHRDNANNFR